MDVTAIACLILLIGIIVGIALGVPIAVVIGVTSVIAIFVLLGNDPSTTTMNTASEVFTGINSFTLLAIPFFILAGGDRKSTRLNSSHVAISYAVFCLKKKK